MAWGRRDPVAEQPLFLLPVDGEQGHDLRGLPIIAVDVETTGLSPREDRIVEIAVVRMSPDGRVEDEWASLINPGRDVGPTFIHHITNEMVADAPTLRDLVGDLLVRLEGGVIASHHATFEEGFLRSELAYLGIELPPLPTVCTLALTRETYEPPNFRLDSCCLEAEIDQEDTGGALGDARMKASLARKLLASAFVDVRWAATPPALPRFQTLARPRTRVTGLRKGTDGWMAGVIAKLPLSTGHRDGPEADAYVEALGRALADGKLTGDEAKALARQAGRAGMGADDLESLHRRFLAGLAVSALEDGVLTTAEYAQMTNAAKLLGQPRAFEYLADELASDQLKPARTKRHSPPRVWCSPGVQPSAVQRLQEIGVVVASNLTQKVRAAVVSPEDVEHEKVVRARHLGIPVLPVTALIELRPATFTSSTWAAPTGPPSAPPWVQAAS